MEKVVIVATSLIFNNGCSKTAKKEQLQCKNVRMLTDILGKFYNFSTEPVQYTFLSVNRRNNEAGAHIAMWSRASLFR